MHTTPVRIEEVGTVGATSAEVYALLADLPRRPEWLTELRRIDAPPGPPAPGTRFEGESAILLHHFVGESEVTHAEPGRVICERVVIGARFTSRWELEDAGERTTRVRHVVDIEYPDGPLGRIERWILRRRMARMQRASIRRLAQVVTGSG